MPANGNTNKVSVAIFCIVTQSRDLICFYFKFDRYVVFDSVLSSRDASAKKMLQNEPADFKKSAQSQPTATATTTTNLSRPRTKAELKEFERSTAPM